MNIFKARSYFEMSDEQGRPTGYLRSPYWSSFALTMVAIVFFFVIAPSSATATPIVIAGIAFASALVFWFKFLSRAEQVTNHHRRVEVRKSEEVRRLSKTTSKSTSTLAEREKTTNQTLEEIKEAMSKIRESSIQTGDIIINSPDTAVVVGSGTIEITRGVQSSDPILAQAMAEVIGFIENSKNEVAASNFEEFLKENEKKEPNRTILKALWDATIAAAPALKEFSEAVSIIKKLFN
ncbi:MAG: hypothetical protein AAFS01_15245 [Pseudomonadota bacterium]